MASYKLLHDIILYKLKLNCFEHSQVLAGVSQLEYVISVYCVVASYSAVKPYSVLNIVESITSAKEHICMARVSLI